MNHLWPRSFPSLCRVASLCSFLWDQYLGRVPELTAISPEEGTETVCSVFGQRRLIGIADRSRTFWVTVPRPFGLFSWRRSFFLIDNVC